MGFSDANKTDLEIVNDILRYINTFGDYCYFSNLLDYSFHHDDCWKDVLDVYENELKNYLFYFNQNIFLNKSQCYRCEFYGRTNDAPESVAKGCICAWLNHGEEFKPCESR